MYCIHFESSKKKIKIKKKEILIPKKRNEQNEVCGGAILWIISLREMGSKRKKARRGKKLSRFFLILSTIKITNVILSLLINAYGYFHLKILQKKAH